MLLDAEEERLELLDTGVLLLLETWLLRLELVIKELELDSTQEEWLYGGGTPQVDVVDTDDAVLDPHPLPHPLLSPP